MPARLASFAHLFEPVTPDPPPGVTMLHMLPGERVLYRIVQSPSFSAIASSLNAQKLGMISRGLDQQKHTTLMFYDTFADENSTHPWASKFAGYDVCGPVLFASMKRFDARLRNALDITDESIACIQYYISATVRIR